mgnify:FL=1
MNTAIERRNLITEGVWCENENRSEKRSFIALAITGGGAIYGTYLICYAIRNIELYEKGEVYMGLPSCFIMIIGCLWGVCMTFCTICRESSTITLDETGVTNKAFFYEESLCWEEVWGYGVVKRSFKFIYISGKRMPKKKAFVMMDNNERRVWYPNVVREKRNQKKKDFFLAFPYKKERWSYVCRMVDKQEEWRREYLEELQEGQGEFGE